MSKKDSNENKPWESQFEDEKDAQGNYSRTATRQQNKNNSRLTTSLLIVFIIIVFGVIALYFLVLRTSHQPVKNTDRIEVVSSSKKVAKSSSKKKVAKSSSKKDSKSSTTQSSSIKEQSSSVAQSSATTSSSSTAASSSSSSAQGQYVTVSAGQGLYRIAVNNGLTIQQLLELNPGLSQGSNLAPGQQIRVK